STLRTNTNVLGQPRNQLNYEVALDAELFTMPLDLGLQGESMTFSGGGTRLYNTLFIRYYIL
ncbi:MAG: hypothetical protein ABH823_03500, partial [bacterium]